MKSIIFSLLVLINFAHADEVTSVEINYELSEKPGETYITLSSSGYKYSIHGKKELVKSWHEYVDTKIVEGDETGKNCLQVSKQKAGKMIIVKFCDQKIRLNVFSFPVTIIYDKVVEVDLSDSVKDHPEKYYMIRYELLSLLNFNINSKEDIDAFAQCEPGYGTYNDLLCDKPELDIRVISETGIHSWKSIF